MKQKPKQFSVGELAAAYSKLRCEPLRMEWIDIEERRCAPSVALMIAHRKMPARKIEELFDGQPFEFCCKHITHHLNTHVSYVSGFELGFALLSDHEISELNLPGYLTSGDEFELGYFDGKNAGLAFE